MVMTRGEKTEAIFAAMWSEIQSAASRAKGDVIESNEGVYSTLRECLSTEDALDAFEHAVREACESAVFLFFVRMDEQRLGFPLAFVDWDTKEKLEPHELFQRAFSFYVYQQKYPETQ